jgi:hypothetical protein
LEHERVFYSTDSELNRSVLPSLGHAQSFSPPEHPITRTPNSLKQIPIFDTNVLADVQRGKIPQSEWSVLLRHRPRHGWPLSSVTAFELLAAIDGAPPENFPSVKERVALAYDLLRGLLSLGRVPDGQDVVKLYWTANFWSRQVFEPMVKFVSEICRQLLLRCNDHFVPVSCG